METEIVAKPRHFSTSQNQDVHPATTTTTTHDAKPLHLAVIGGGNPDVIAALLEAGADIEARTTYKFKELPRVTPLHWAALLGNVDAIATLVEAGAYIEAKYECDRTAMRLAVRHNHVDAVGALAEAGADPDAPDCQGGIAIHEVTDPAMVVALVDAGADVDARGRHGNTALHGAVAWMGQEPNPDLIVTLLAAGANPMARDDSGMTPLHIAVMGIFGVPSPTSISLLLDAGAGPGAEDNNGKSPWHYAEGHRDLVGTAVYERLRTLSQ